MTQPIPHSLTYQSHLSNIVEGYEAADSSQPIQFDDKRDPDLIVHYGIIPELIPFDDLRLILRLLKEETFQIEQTPFDDTLRIFSFLSPEVISRLEREKLLALLKTLSPSRPPKDPIAIDRRIAQVFSEEGKACAIITNLKDFLQYMRGRHMATLLHLLMCMTPEEERGHLSLEILRAVFSVVPLRFFSTISLHPNPSLIQSPRSNMPLILHKASTIFLLTQHVPTKPREWIVENLLQVPLSVLKELSSDIAIQCIQKLLPQDFPVLGLPITFVLFQASISEWMDAHDREEVYLHLREAMPAEKGQSLLLFLAHSLVDLVPQHEGVLLAIVSQLRDKNFEEILIKDPIFLLFLLHHIGNEKLHALFPGKKAYFSDLFSRLVVSLEPILQAHAHEEELFDESHFSSELLAHLCSSQHEYRPILNDSLILAYFLEQRYPAALQALRNRPVTSKDDALLHDISSCVDEKDTLAFEATYACLKISLSHSPIPVESKECNALLLALLKIGEKVHKPDGWDVTKEPLYLLFKAFWNSHFPGKTASPIRDFIEEDLEGGKKLWVDLSLGDHICNSVSSSTLPPQSFIEKFKLNISKVKRVVESALLTNDQTVDWLALGCIAPIYAFAIGKDTTRRVVIALKTRNIALSAFKTVLGFQAIGSTRLLGCGQNYVLGLARAGKESEAFQDFPVEAEVSSLARRKENFSILSMHLTETRQREIAILMEYCDGGNLEDFLNRENPSRAVRLSIGIQIANALQWLKDNGIVHSDVKSRNILIKSLPGGNSYQVKIGDFGLANIVPITPFTTQIYSRGITTPGFSAPEIITKKEVPLSFAFDDWALGAVLFQIFHPNHFLSSFFMKIQMIIREGFAGDASAITHFKDLILLYERAKIFDAIYPDKEVDFIASLLTFLSFQPTPSPQDVSLQAIQLHNTVLDGGVEFLFHSDDNVDHVIAHLLTRDQSQRWTAKKAADALMLCR